MAPRYGAAENFITTTTTTTAMSSGDIWPFPVMNGTEIIDNLPMAGVAYITMLRNALYVYMQTLLYFSALDKE